MSIDPPDAVRVCIVCAKPDKGFATDLMDGLTLSGLEIEILHPTIEQQNPVHIILRSDVIIFVLSQESLETPTTVQFLNASYELGKHIILTPIESVSRHSVPEILLNLPFVNFSEDRGFGTSLKELANLSKRDMPWIKEHTRLAKLAYQWNSHGRIRALLLKGADLDRARSWLANAPDNSARVTRPQSALILASIEVTNGKQINILNHKSFRRSYAAVLLLGCVAGYFGYQWSYEAFLHNQTEEALLASNNELEHLRAVQMRLTADIRLPASNRASDSILSSSSKWYPTAASHSGSFGRFLPANGTSPFQSDLSGVVIDGSLVSASFDNQYLLLAPSLAKNNFNDQLLAMGDDIRPYNSEVTSISYSETQDAPERVLYTVVEEVKDDENGRFQLSAIVGPNELKVGAQLWQSKAIIQEEGAFALYQLHGELPVGLEPLGLKDIDCASSFETAPLNLGVLDISTDVQDQDYADLLFSQTRTDSADNRINYGFSGQSVDIGSPIFNIENGQFIALHAGESSRRRKVSYAIPIRFLLDEARLDLSLTRYKLNPICQH